MTRAEISIAVVEETLSMSPAIAERAPRPARAANDPRNQDKTAADDEAEAVALSELDYTDAVPPALDLPAVDTVTTKSRELTTEERGADKTTNAAEQEIDAQPADAGMDADAHSKPDEVPTADLGASADFTDLDSEIENTQAKPAPEGLASPAHAVDHNPGPIEILEEEADKSVAQNAILGLAKEIPKTERPSRAANDPREVKRREREARAQDVIANGLTQDITEGSSWSELKLFSDASRTLRNARGSRQKPDRNYKH